MAANQQQLPPRMGSFPPNFQPPANMPNINFSAPVIRLGTSGPAGAAPGGRSHNSEPMGGRRGLGMDRGMGDHHGRQSRMESMALIPPTREEIMRTIFVGKIPAAVSDADIERIFRSAGNLRRWNRAFDADGKPCTFGFAEYEDAESLETAAEVFVDIEVPSEKIEPKPEQNGDAADIKKAKLLVGATILPQWSVANQRSDSSR
jgi:RNA recognition motif-containing protein